MRRTKAFLLAAALGGMPLLAAGAAHAQGCGGGGPPHGPRAFLMIEQFDLNKDGKVTQEEIDQARKDQFANYDADHDGTLSLQEYQNLWLDVMRRAMVRQFQANDSDGDAKITVEEFTARFGDVARELDRNGDGVISADEMQPRGHHGPGWGGRAMGGCPMMPAGPPPGGPHGPGGDAE